MKDFNKIISGLSSSGLLSGLAGGVAGGALSSAVMSKKGRKMGKSALKLGALAAVGGVAWKAYQSYSQKNAQTVQPQGHQQPQYSSQPVPTSSTYTPSQPAPNLTYSPATLTQNQFEKVVADENNESGQMIILRAMITAANTDGHIDENERQRIYDQVDNLELSMQDKAGLFDELRHPMSLEQQVAAVPNFETAVEVYAASVLAIDEQQAQSQHYLNRLATSMMIPRELVDAVHHEASAMTQA